MYYEDFSEFFWCKIIFVLVFLFQFWQKLMINPGWATTKYLNHSWPRFSPKISFPVDPKYRPSFKVTSSKPGSDLAGETAASFAAASILFKEDDEDYSTILLDHAKRLYHFADKYRGKYSDAITNAAEFYEKVIFIIITFMIWTIIAWRSGTWSTLSIVLILNETSTYLR